MAFWEFQNLHNDHFLLCGEYDYIAAQRNICTDIQLKCWGSWSEMDRGVLHVLHTFTIGNRFLEQ